MLLDLVLNLLHLNCAILAVARGLRRRRLFSPPPRTAEARVVEAAADEFQPQASRGYCSRQRLPPRQGAQEQLVRLDAGAAASMRPLQRRCPARHARPFWRERKRVGSIFAAEVRRGCQYAYYWPL